MLHSWRSIGTAVHRVHSHDDKDEHQRVNEHIPCRLSLRLEPDKSLVRVSQDEQQTPYNECETNCVVPVCEHNQQVRHPPAGTATKVQGVKHTVGDVMVLWDPLTI